MSNRVISFSIAMKDAVTVAAKAAASSMRDMREEVKAAQDAVARAEKDAEALKNAQDALAESTKKAAQAQKAANPENMLHGKSLQDILDAEEALVPVMEAHAKAQADVIEAQEKAAKSAAKASGEVARLQKAVAKESDGLDSNGQSLNRFSRALDALSKGNIPGALNALGGLGAAILKASSIAGIAYTAFRKVSEYIERMRQKAHEARMEAFNDAIRGIARDAEKAATVLEMATTRIERLRSAAKEKIVLRVESEGVARRAAAAQSEVDLARALAGAGSDAERAGITGRYRRETLSRQAYGIRNDANAQREQIAVDDAAAAREIEAQRRNLRMIEERIERERQVYRRARGDRNRMGDYGALSDGDKARAREIEGVRDAALGRLDKLYDEAMVAERRIRDLEAERVRLASARKVATAQEAASLKEIEASLANTQKEERERAEAARKAAEEAERAAAARSEEREAAMAHAVEVATAGGDAHRAAQAEQEWAMRPYEARKAKAAESLEAAERELADLRQKADGAQGQDERLAMLDAIEQKEREILAIKIEQKDAEEELRTEQAKLQAAEAGRQKAVLEQTNKARLEQWEQAKKDAKELAERQRQDEIAEAEAMFGGTSAQRREARRAERQRERAVRRRDTALTRAQEYFRRLNNGNDLAIGGNGEVISAQQGAFRRLSRRDQKLLLEDAKRRAEKEKADANANALLNAANSANMQLEDINDGLSKLKDLGTILDALRVLQTIDDQSGQNLT